VLLFALFPERLTLPSLLPLSYDADETEVASIWYAVPWSERDPLNPVKGVMISSRFVDIPCDSAVVGDMSADVPWTEPKYDPWPPTSLELERECNVGLFKLWGLNGGGWFIMLIIPLEWKEVGSES